MTQRQSQVRLLSLHKFAQLCRTTPRTIRFYDKSGLLKPERVDSFTSYRYYREEQVRDFFKIKLLQTFGVSLKDIPNALSKYSEESFLEERLKRIREEIDEKEKEHKFLKNIKSFLFEDVEKLLKTEDMGPFVLFCRFYQHTKYHSINPEIIKLYEEAEKLGIKTADKEIVIYNDPFRYGPNDTSLEIGLICSYKSIPKDLVLPQGYYFKEYKKQKCLTYDYRGPFEYLTFIHSKIVLSKFARERFKGEPFDIYIFGPLNIKSQYDYLTKAGYPIDEGY